MQLYEIRVLAGDFCNFEGFDYCMCNGERFRLATPEHKWKGESIPTTELAEMSVASEESVKRLGGSIGLGFAGGVLFGPLGLIAGALAGGNKKEVTFIAQFKDGRKLLGVCEQKTFVKMQAAVFMAHNNDKSPSDKDSSWIDSYTKKMEAKAAKREADLKAKGKYSDAEEKKKQRYLSRKKELSDKRSEIKTNSETQQKKIEEKYQRNKIRVPLVISAFLLISYAVWFQVERSQPGYEERIARETEQRELQKAADEVARQNKWRSKDHSTEAHVMLQDHVRAQLKSPSTAKFPWSAEGVAVTRDGTEYTVHAWVDSQNSFGAMIRTAYTGKIRQVSEYSWQLISLEFDQ